MFGKIKEALNNLLGKEMFTAEMTEAEVHDKLSDLTPLANQVDHSDEITALKADINSLTEENKTLKESMISKETVENLIIEATKDNVSISDFEELQKDVAEVKANKIVTSTQIAANQGSDYDDQNLKDDMKAFANKMKKAKEAQAKLRKEMAK